MKDAWIDVRSYMSIIEQAAKHDGLAVIHSRGSDPLMIKIDTEYAKKEWTEIEEELSR